MWFAYVAYTGIAPISGIYYGIGSSEMIKLLSFFWVVLPIIILVLKGDSYCKVCGKYTKKDYM